MVDIFVLMMMSLVALGVTYALGVRRGRMLAKAQRFADLARSDHGGVRGGQRPDADPWAGRLPTT